MKLEKFPQPNKHSQNGEEQFIMHWAEQVGIGLKDIAVCEYGASTGPENSNTFIFAEGGSRALFVEADKKRFRKLLEATSSFEKERVKVVDKTVQTEGKDTIENIWKESFPGINPNVVSIDIDGDDWYHLEALNLNPDMIIIEFNPTIPIDSDFVPPSNSTIGTGAKPLLDLGEKKGFFLAAVTATNLILLNESYREVFLEISIEAVLDQERQVRFAVGYDGTLLRFEPKGLDLTAQVMDLGWSGASIHQPIWFKFRFLSPKMRKAVIRLTTTLSFRPKSIAWSFTKAISGIKSFF